MFLRVKIRSKQETIEKYVCMRFYMLQQYAQFTQAIDVGKLILVGFTIISSTYYHYTSFLFNILMIVVDNCFNIYFKFGSI